MSLTRDNVVATKLSRYLDALFEHLADKVAPRVAERLAEQEGWAATLDVLHDSELMDDIRRADEQADEDAQPYEEVRRELGLA